MSPARRGREEAAASARAHPEQVLDVRSMMTVGEISTSARGLAAEVEIDHLRLGLDRASVVDGVGLHTVAQARLTSRVGQVDEDTLTRVCSAVSYALGC
jgi:mRNA-degrading endonuclease toxin of MazEF toxin-antitoxin module